MTRRSYGARLYRGSQSPNSRRKDHLLRGLAYPDTSLTISRTNWVRLLSFPLEREMRGLTSRLSVFYMFAGMVSVHRLLLCRRDPPRGETYVTLVWSDGNAAAFGGDGHCVVDDWRCCRWSLGERKSRGFVRIVAEVRALVS